MERESFEDFIVADILNKNFISIKVDREERPDVDHIYMTACQLTTQSGGWPLSVFIDSDKKPFFAGTYYPKQSRGQFIGFIEVLEQINRLWHDNRSILFETRDKIVAAISANNEANVKSKKSISPSILETAFEQLQKSFDNRYGGFGSAPKFPVPHRLIFLIRYNAPEMAEKTLQSMYKGGIYDHIGYGFSRYSTDNKWLAPHFEKMIYDNALHIIAYTECYLATGNPFYAKVADDIAKYILRDMTSTEGGFYSAEDADSEGIEGKFYTWTAEEIESILGKNEGKHFCEIYDITKKGNFERVNIPNLIKSNALNTTASHGTDFSDLNIGLNPCIKKLFKARDKRIHPFKDDKILTSWNGLVIAALAISGRALSSYANIAAAKKAADFILDSLYKNKILMSRYRNGDVRYMAYADDYSFFIWGLVELYEATLLPRYLEKALELMDLFLSECWDTKNGGFFLNSINSEQLITRPKEIYDGAIPSANSVAAYNLARLSKLTGIYGYADKAQDILDSFSNQIEQAPLEYCFSLIALLYISSSIELVVTSKSLESAQSLLDSINRLYLPNMTVLFYDGKNGLDKTVNMLKDYIIPEQGALVYVCNNGSCQPPVDNINSLKNQRLLF